MKKSFMTRALATGLSLAMAFSLTAATNVTTAAAAAKPAMKASQMTVKEGKSKTFLATAKTLKTYKITKAKVKNASAKQYISVKKNAKGTGIVVTGKKGADTARKIVITFQNKKTKKTTNLTTKVVVKVVAPVEEKLTMTAEATHANEIVATFNKAVGSDAKVTLKKGASDVANTAKIAEDGKSATITLTGKLTDGTYTVTVVAGEETVSADVIAKSEVLTSFKLGTTLKEKVASYNNASSTATAVLSYQALNQYGDKINYTAADNSVVSSIGRVGNIKPCKTTQAGSFEVYDIPAMYAIKGQQFQISIVDTVNYTGVMINDSVVYGAGATAKEFTLAGTYNTSKQAFKDIADGDKVADYVMLFTVKDQYTDDMDAKTVATEASNAAIQVTIAGGLTNIKATTLKGLDLDKMQKEIGDTTYFAVPLESVSTDKDKKVANAGTYRVTIVNSTQGSVYDQEFTIADGVIVSSVQITAADTLYANQDNAMDYVVTDSQGNTLKDYATLKNISVDSTKDGDKYTWKKNTDGTASLIYTPATVASDVVRKYKGSEVRGCTIKANKEVSGKLYVASKTFTVYEERQPVTVTGTKSDAARVSTNANDLAFETKKLVILDQYSNPFSEDEIKNGDHNTLNNVYVTLAAVTAGNTITVSNGSVEYYNGSTSTVKPDKIAKKITITGLANTVSNSSIKLNFFVSSAAAKVVNGGKGDEGADVSFTYGNTNKVSGLTVAYINNGCPLYANDVDATAYLTQSTSDSASAADYLYVNNGTGHFMSTAAPVVVKGTIGGKTGVVPTNQWKFVGAGQDNRLALKGVKSYSLAGEVITETREFSIVVDTEDGPQTITGKVDVSNAPRVGTTISANDTDKVSGTYAKTDVITANAVRTLFTTKNQYNEVVTGSDTACELINYTVNDLVVSGDAIEVDGTSYATGKSISVDYIKFNLPGTNSASFYLDSTNIKPGTNSTLVAKVRVTAQASKDSTKTATKDITVEFKLQ